MGKKLVSIPAPVVRRIRAYMAPADRAARMPTVFDAARYGRFELDNPPSPWIDLGWVRHFTRKSNSKRVQVETGIPASTAEQVLQSVAAEVSFEFLSWTKLSMALSTGSQHMNLLAAEDGGAPAGCGSSAVPALNVKSGSTATRIALEGQDSSRFSAGDVVVIDVDNDGRTGFIGTPIPAAFVRHKIEDVDYIRRVSFNVAVVSEVNADGITLATALPGGVPDSDAKMQLVKGFVDRESGSFHLEWSGLFAIEGTQDERVYYYYPRLQTKTGAEEHMGPIDKTGEYERVLLMGQFLALPVTDPLDGERVLCYRSFLPVPNALI